jgi:hypothetical protein
MLNEMRFTFMFCWAKNKAKASNLPAILSGCNRFSHQQLISDFGEPAAGRYIASCLPVNRAGPLASLYGRLFPIVH